MTIRLNHRQNQARTAVCKNIYLQIRFGEQSNRRQPCTSGGTVSRPFSGANHHSFTPRQKRFPHSHIMRSMARHLQENRWELNMSAPMLQVQAEIRDRGGTHAHHTQRIRLEKHKTAFLTVTDPAAFPNSMQSARSASSTTRQKNEGSSLIAHVRVGLSCCAPADGGLSLYCDRVLPRRTKYLVAHGDASARMWVSTKKCW